MKDKIKELRIKIDGLSQLTKELKPFIDGLESSKTMVIYNSTDSLLFAKAWLGKVLAELGTENPYKSGYNSKEDIQPTADVANHNDKVSVHYELPYYEMNHIQKVDFIRTEIEKLVLELKDLGSPPNPPLLNREMSIARTNAYTHLCEAKFWLGFELERIKNEK